MESVTFKTVPVQRPLRDGDEAPSVVEPVSVVSTCIDGVPVEFDFSSGSYTTADEKEIACLRSIVPSIEGVEEVDDPPAAAPARSRGRSVVEQPPVVEQPSGDKSEGDDA